MTKVGALTLRRSELLNKRRTIAVELPEFAIRALEYRVAVTNDEADEDEAVDFNDVVEWYLISPLSVKELPHLEAAVPGFNAALAKWLFDSNYRPVDEE